MKMIPTWKVLLGTGMFVLGAMSSLLLPKMANNSKTVKK